MATKETGSDDYALERVPREARYGWVPVALQRFGQVSALSQFLLGAAIGFGMYFWDAILALLLGSVILQIVAIMTGIIGQREGLSTSLLARWTGFGKYGASLIALLISLSLIGWFGVQSGVAANGLVAIMPAIPAWIWSLVIGLLVTVIVVYGFKSMAWTAYITVPAFLLLAGWAVFSELQRHDLAVLVSQPPPGPTLSMAAGATLVAGGFIAGMVITPDMTRYNRKASDVVKQTVLGVTLGEFTVALSGILLAHALKTNDIIEIVTSSSGFVGVIIIVAGTLKMNDWNLYSASLGIVNFIDTVFHKRVGRGAVTVFVGTLGSLVAAAGILDYFVDFLIMLGIVFPPVAGIMAAEYYVVKKWRAELSNSAPGLPAKEPTWVIGTLVVWAAAILVAVVLPWGVPSVNSLLASLVLYVVVGKLGLIKGTSQSEVGEQLSGQQSSTMENEFKENK